MHLLLIVMVEDDFSLSSVCAWLCGNHCKLKIYKFEECSFKYETLMRLYWIFFNL